VDGDDDCDFLPGPGATPAPGPDDVCVFKVAVCMNNNDKLLLPKCNPSGVSAITVLGPLPRRLTPPEVQAAVAADLAAVQNAVLSLLDPLAPCPTPTPSCLGQYIYGPPLEQEQIGLCSAPFDIKVVLMGRRKRSVIIKTLSYDGSLEPNVSKLKLTCIAP
jgi:hypothetical protein